MIDMEKVIKGLEKCKRNECDDCTEKGTSQAPWDCPAYDDFVDSALALLKEQEAMVPIHAVADWLAGYAVPPSKTSLDHAEMAAAWTKFLEQLKG